MIGYKPDWVQCGQETNQEGPEVNDRAVELLEQYEIEVLRTRKGRGAILCETNQGYLILKEYAGSQERIALQDRLLKQAAEAGLVQAERIVPDREGALFVKDNDGVKYVLKTWQDGRECNIHDRGECAEAVRLLARLHGNMTLTSDTPGLPEPFSAEKDYEKRNRELKRVRNYLQQKKQKSWFELNLRKALDGFLEQALAVTEEWKEYAGLPVKDGQGAAPMAAKAYSGAEPADRDAAENVMAAGKDGQRAAVKETVSFCHGDYQYHNILQGSNGWFLVNFEKYQRDNPVRDLYLLLRKLLEKENWSVSLGAELLEAYEKERPISAYSRIDLYYRLAYPEKFWKIANFYYNSGKAWIPGKNQEKLEKVIAQEKEKQCFLDEVFRDVSHLR